MIENRRRCAARPLWSCTLLALFVNLVPVARLADAAATVAPLAANSAAPGQVAEQTDDAPAGPLAVGIDGVYRIGCWTGLRAASPAGHQLLQRTAWIETLDGAANRVRYQCRPTSGGEPLWQYATSGSDTARLTLLDDQGEPLWEGRFGGRPLQPATPWVVVFGDSLGIDQIGRNELLDRQATVAVSQIRHPDALPDQTAGWEGVDLLVISPGAAPLLGSLDTARWDALQRWLRGGGQLLLSLGRTGGELLQSLPQLASLVDIDGHDQPLRLDPAALETFTTSQTPLAPLEGYPLPLTGSRVLLSGRTAARQPTPLVIERSAGLGRIIVTSFALDGEVLAEWPQRLTLVTQLHAGLLHGDVDRRRETRSTAAVAYDDLAGQVRAALDRFDSNGQLPFSIISVIILALIALLGPVDYLLVNRWLRRPWMTWLSFPLVIVAVSALMISLANRQAGGQDAPSAIRRNRIEVVDISRLGDQPLGRARVLTHTSSRRAQRADFVPSVTPQWLEIAAAAPAGTADDSPAPRSLTRPHGFAGSTFGGIRMAGTDWTLPAYRLVLGQRDTTSLPQGPLVGGALAFPLAPGGSKSWWSSWEFEPQLGPGSSLERRPGSELLAGSLTNPLPIDLLDATLAFGNWAYLLPTRFRAGQRIASVDTLRQKNFRWHLTRRESIDGDSGAAGWDVEMDDDLPRLTEVLMFESALGGRDYTGLNNHPLNQLDLSGALQSGHAVLFGHVAEPVLGDDFSAEQPTVTAVRLVLPVASPSLDQR